MRKTMLAASLACGLLLGFLLVLTAKLDAKNIVAPAVRVITVGEFRNVKIIHYETGEHLVMCPVVVGLGNDDMVIPKTSITCTKVY